MVTTSTTEAEYVATTSCCGQDVRDCKLMVLAWNTVVLFLMQEKGIIKDAAYGQSLNMLPVSNKETAGSYKVVTAAIGRG
ncbi:hypothetical protein Tco_1253585 [Tanacetum coccineum]